MWQSSFISPIELWMLKCRQSGEYQTLTSFNSLQNGNEDSFNAEWVSYRQVFYKKEVIQSEYFIVCIFKIFWGQT